MVHSGTGGARAVLLAAGAPAAVSRSRGRYARRRRLSAQRAPLDASGALADPGFESGGTTVWTQCGPVNATVQSTTVHSGSYAMQAGSATSEPNGNAALCQKVTVPGGSPKLTLWTNEKTNETSTTYAYQEISLRSASNTSTVLATLYKGLSTSGWTLRTYDVSAYAGQSVRSIWACTGTARAATTPACGSTTSPGPVETRRPRPLPP